MKAIFCSAENRALETANIIAEGSDLKSIIIEELGERDWGDWASKPWEEIEAKLTPMSLKERFDFIPPKGESWQQMEDRLLKAVEHIAAGNYATVAIVTHSGALRALMPALKNEPRETSFQYNFQNASVTGFEYNAGRWQLLYENNIAHLGL